MDTVRVDIYYRPLRICWAIASTDIASFRKAVRSTHCFFGGRFNPIVFADRPEEATRIVELFGADLLVPLGDAAVTKPFVDRFPHLINPMFPERIFIGEERHGFHSNVLDVHNLLVHAQADPAWGHLPSKFQIVTWDESDPLADTFLVQFGGYPARDETGIDYLDLVKGALKPDAHAIGLNDVISRDALEHPSLAYLARAGLSAHHRGYSGRNRPGYFFGSSSNLADLVTFWNLRAANISTIFVDPSVQDRYAEIIPTWNEHVAELLARAPDKLGPRGMNVWSQGQPHDTWQERVEETRKVLGVQELVMDDVSEHSWNGLNIAAPMMYLGKSTSLGVLMTDGAKPKLSFAFADKPFSGETWFHTQKLVASLSFIGGLYRNDSFTLRPPYAPELNEFLARTMHFQYGRLRVEPDRIGFVIDASDTDEFIYALPVDALFKAVFGLAGFNAQHSRGGLMARQLIAQLGGLRGAIAFKIPGVRRLLKTFGPTDAFTKSSALGLIGKPDPDNPAATFAQHKDLYLEPRSGGDLTQQDVFTYLVDKKLFRIGYELLCPTCQITSWTSLEELRQQVSCDMCGNTFDATRQLIKEQWHYRRSGVLGVEKNVQGAIPVLMTLQQLDANLHSVFGDELHSTSLDLTPKVAGALPTCEVDFGWITTGGSTNRDGRTSIIIGECKDRGTGARQREAGTINANDIENLKAVADAFPRHRFRVYILFAKLASFTQEEIALARSLNGKYEQRVILLTDRELEPYRIYERTKKELGTVEFHASRAEDLAMATAAIYFPDEEPPKIDPLAEPQPPNADAPGE